jgi:hypothetical protein
MDKADKKHKPLAGQQESLLPQRSRRHQEVLEYYRKELFKDKPLPGATIERTPEEQQNHDSKGIPGTEKRAPRRKPIDYELLAKLAKFYERPQYQIDAINYYRKEFEKRGNLKVDPAVRAALQRKVDESAMIQRQEAWQRSLDESPLIKRQIAEKEALQAK